MMNAKVVVIFSMERNKPLHYSTDDHGTLTQLNSVVMCSHYEAFIVKRTKFCMKLLQEKNPLFALHFRSSPYHIN